MSAPQLTRITEQDAAQDSEQLFAPAPTRAYPVRAYAISVLSPAGFPITLTYNDMTLDRLDEALSTLLGRGYMPAEAPSVFNAPAGAVSPNAPAPVQQPAAPTGEAPVCPVHTDRRMKVSNYGGWFCTATNLATGEKCKEKVK